MFLNDMKIRSVSFTYASLAHWAQPSVLGAFRKGRLERPRPCP
jgi:hypothetical protein